MTIHDDARTVLHQADREALTIVSVKEYAALFRVSARAVYYAIKADKMPYAVFRPCGGKPTILVPTALISKLQKVA